MVNVESPLFAAPNTIDGEVIDRDDEESCVARN